MNQNKPDYKKQISQILVKWAMPTRQVAINEIIRIITKAEQAINKRCNEECEKRIVKEVKLAEERGYWKGLGSQAAVKEMSKIPKTSGKNYIWKLPNTNEQ